MQGHFFKTPSETPMTLSYLCCVKISNL